LKLQVKATVTTDFKAKEKEFFMAFFELRQYRTKLGQRENWVKYMEETILPFQISKGMVVIGSFIGEEEDDLYVWIRRFESEAQRERLYAAVYEDDRWKNELSPRVGELIDREQIVVTRLEPTSRSAHQ
jgi:hypothetical protein